MLSPLGRKNTKPVGGQARGSQQPQSLNEDLGVAAVSHQPSWTPLLPWFCPRHLSAGNLPLSQPRPAEVATEPCSLGWGEGLPVPDLRG